MEPGESSVDDKWRITQGLGFKTIKDPETLEYQDQVPSPAVPDSVPGPDGPGAVAVFWFFFGENQMWKDDGTWRLRLDVFL